MLIHSGANTMNARTILFTVVLILIDCIVASARQQYQQRVPSHADYSRRIPSKKGRITLKPMNQPRKRPPLQMETTLRRYLEPPAANSVSHYRHYLLAKDESFPKNHRPNYSSVAHRHFRKDRPHYVRDHDPFNDNNDYDNNEQDNKATQSIEHKTKKKQNKKSSLELSPDGDRVEFHIQGQDGPATYVFGFDTGDEKNRQFRLEEKSKDGTVKGHYGYYDARGKLRAIKYVARPEEGYVEKHHQQLSNGSSEEKINYPTD
ncbi:uncharacterized protein LOC106660552 [Trichogramma pretiosum]|uniref:uncharacterized protein LOC106660552 n=1 Tax=Trichogramma pretiosum TaxID=7493 RepID=UPI0006C99D20|nr:uncharacterized protein LOC106660552 [Trichogramma pretiosum]